MRNKDEKHYRGIEKLTDNPFLNLYHIDAYRLENTPQDLGFDEYFYDDGLTVIEWAQFVPYLIPDAYLNVSITLGEDGSRKFVLTAHGSAYEALLEVLA